MKTSRLDKFNKPYPERELANEYLPKRTKNKSDAKKLRIRRAIEDRQDALRLKEETAYSWDELED